MKTIGLIGGLSWESSVEYYRIINDTVKQKLGGLHSAKVCMISLDLEEIRSLVTKKEPSKIIDILSDAARRIENAGADCLLICANTTHRFAKEIQESVRIPLIHIVDKTAEEIIKAGMKKVGLFGTRITMEEAFYKDMLLTKYNIETLIPDMQDRSIIDQIIFKELCSGIKRKESSKILKKIIQKLQNQGAQGIILGCTEIGLLIKNDGSSVPLFDTTKIHAEAAVNYALS